jgi:hypothetical protein
LSCCCCSESRRCCCESCCCSEKKPLNQQYIGHQLGGGDGRDGLGIKGGSWSHKSQYTPKCSIRHLCCQ